MQCVWLPRLVAERGVETIGAGRPCATFAGMHLTKLPEAS